MREPFHPSTDSLDLVAILAALSDPTRLTILLRLAEAEADIRCGDFTDLATKSNLSYHFAKMREAGLVSLRSEGTSRFLTLRRDDSRAAIPRPSRSADCVRQAHGEQDERSPGYGVAGRIRERITAETCSSLSGSRNFAAPKHTSRLHRLFLWERAITCHRCCQRCFLNPIDQRCSETPGFFRRTRKRRPKPHVPEHSSLYGLHREPNPES